MWSYSKTQRALSNLNHKSSKAGVREMLRHPPGFSIISSVTHTPLTTALPGGPHANNIKPTLANKQKQPSRSNFKHKNANSHVKKKRKAAHFWTWRESRKKKQKQCLERYVHVSPQCIRGEGEVFTFRQDFRGESGGRDITSSRWCKTPIWVSMLRKLNIYKWNSYPKNETSSTPVKPM